MIKYRIINEDGSSYETLEMPASGVFETIEFELPEEVIEVPQEVHNHKLRLALIHFGVMPTNIDMAIEAMTDLVMREKIFTLWNFAPMLERADTSLNYMATQFEISQPVLDQIFIYANALR